MSKYLLIGLLMVSILYSGCTTKAKIIDGKRYTQTWGSNEWQYAGEVKPAEQNASTPEESISYAVGQIAGALAVTGAHIITSPIRAVETVSKTDSNTSW
jgi:hypothetical protein